MMKPTKLLSLPLALSLALAATSCGGNDSRPLSELGKISTADTLSFLYGQMYADNYWRMNVNDSAALSTGGRDSYLRGIEKGLALGADDDAYADGVITGLQFALGIAEMQKELGVELSKDYIIRGMKNGLKSDSAVDIAVTQTIMNRILQRLGEKRDKENAKEAVKGLKGVASRMKLTPFASGVYGRIEKAGNGDSFKEGDRVHAGIRITSADGKELSLPPFPDEITIGSDPFADTPVEACLYKLRPGSQAVLATSADDLFGQETQRLNIQPSATILIHLSFGGLIE